ncbi:MAG: BatA domain-containing protein [Verrucomicrobiales bacterium]|nr:BatA domain-containing protein [Verrucomicrobiales bacterium]
MSFLFPLYLLGAAALAVPILLHLRRRPPKEHIPFSSHIFLEKTPERLTRRTKLERWLLLALRCLALLLLALAFTRPFFRSSSLAGGEASRDRAVVLIDRSASMQREDLWDQAREEAKEAIRRFSEQDEIALALFDKEMELVADLPEWAALGERGRINALEELTANKTKLSWKGTNLGSAMIQSADLLLAADADSPAGKREVIVISDFQDGAARERLQAEVWPEEVIVRLVQLTAKEAGNLSINLAATPPRANVEEEEVYRVRIRNAADSDSASARLLWKGFPDTAIETTIAPGTSRILTSSVRPEAATRGILAVEGDTHEFDNEIYVSPVQARPLRILFLANGTIEESAGSPLFYLRRAMQPTPTLNPIVTAATGLDTAPLEETEVIIVAGDWSEEIGKQLHDFAEKGGLVISIPSAKTSEEAFSALMGEEDWKLGNADVEDYALLADLDFEHPVLEAFARAQIRDFTKVRFWKHRTLSLPEELPDSTRVIATFDGESPALVEHRIGDGAAFTFLSGWEPQESQLALSSKFVPLLFSIFEHTGFSIRSAATLYVGETEYPRPGFYETGEEKKLTAVNLHPTEGNTAPFDPVASFTEWGIPLVDKESEEVRSTLTETQLARLESVEKEESQKLWKWLILAALLFLILESWLAGKPGGFRKRTRTTSGTTPAPST